MSRVHIFGLLLLGVGCRSEDVFFEPHLSFERMLEQPRYDPYEKSEFFPDGRNMREPPEGTLPYDLEEPLDPAKGGGIAADGGFVGTIPLHIDMSLLARGRGRFEQFCGPCHGVRGDGDTVVARHMQRPPPSLHQPRIRALADGEIYFVIELGYGMMPGYAAQLPYEDRWAVVAYLRALQRSQNVTVAELPPDLRRSAEKELP